MSPEFSTVKGKTSELMTHYYGATYEDVFNAAIDVIRSFKNWDIEDIDKEFGVIVASDSNFWGTYTIRIIVKKVNKYKTKVDISASTPSNRAFITEFYNKLNDIMRRGAKHV